MKRILTLIIVLMLFGAARTEANSATIDAGVYGPSEPIYLTYSAEAAAAGWCNIYQI